MGMAFFTSTALLRMTSSVEFFLKPKRETDFTLIPAKVEEHRA
jgi:hypothetical protein